MNKSPKCYEPFRHLYVERKDNGYLVKPCCTYNGNERLIVSDISEIKNSQPLKDMRKHFYENKDWKISGCDACIKNEQASARSRRIMSLTDHRNPIIETDNEYNLSNDITHWDLRPSNTCNLKCIMCNPDNSSKWYEDSKIFDRYNDTTTIASDKNRKEIDLDYVFEHAKNKARQIYIAGGEPFYMNNVIQLLEKLSNINWNCENTRIDIVTNGVSNTEKLINILKKFAKVHISVSYDGYGEVDELIRFPTDWNKKVVNIEELKSACSYFSFNLTVFALNLPVVEESVNKVAHIGKTRLNKLYNPEFLNFNSLHPDVVEKIYNETSMPLLKEYLKDYSYNETNAGKMRNYLNDLDSKRGTDSKKILPWCFKT